MPGSADGRQLSTPVWRLCSRTVADNGTIVLVLEGRLGHASASQLKAMGEGAAQGSKDVVLDLAAVDYLSSASLKVIADLAAELADRGGVLTVRSPSPAARLSLELAGLSAMFRA